MRDLAREPALRRQLWRLLPGALLGAVAASASVGLLGLSGWFVTASALAGASGVLTFSYFFASGGVRALALTRTLTRYGERLDSHAVTLSLLGDLRAALFRRALALRPARLARWRSGELLGRVTADVDTLDLVPLAVVLPTLALLGAALSTALFVAARAPALAAVLLGAFGLVGGLLPLWAAWRGRAAGAALVRARAAVRTRLVEAVEGWPELVSYGAQGRVGNALAADLARAEGARGALRLGDAATAGLAAAVSGAALLALAWVGPGTLDAPGAVMVALLGLGLLDAAEALPAGYRGLGRARAAAARLSDLVGPDAEPAQGTRPFPPEHDLRAANLTFTYPGAPRPAVWGVNLTLPAGTWAAVTGPSGAGKSTLLGLLAGEERPDAGRVEIGGVALGDIQEPGLRAHLTLVGQDAGLFSGTLRDNLRLAGPGAEDGTLCAALCAARLGPWLEGLPDGLDTWLGEHGAALSGGQRRRLSVAQALLRRPAVLLLDEPTAGLDAETAAALLDGVRAWLPGSSVVLATHDRAAVARCPVRLALAAPEAP